jgi:hypothetical protein
MLMLYWNGKEGRGGCIILQTNLEVFFVHT